MCWPGAGRVVSLGPATFAWVLLSENLTQIWPRYYNVMEKHEQNRRGEGGKARQRCRGVEVR